MWKRIGFTGGARLYFALGGLISLILTARVLGADGRGIVAASLTWVALFSTIGCLSLGQVALHRAASREGEGWLGETMATLLAVTAVATIAGWIVGATLYVATDAQLYGDMPAYALVLAMAALPLLIWEQYASSMLMGVDRLATYNRALVVGRTVGLAVLFLLVFVADTGVAGALVAALVTQGMVALAGFGLLLERARDTFRVKWAVARGILVDGAKLHLNAIGNFLFLSASILIVQYYRGAEETGQFQVVVQAIMLALIVPQAASMVLYSDVARLGPDRAWATNRRVLIRVSLAVAALGAVAAALAPILIPGLLGDDFEPAVPVFQLMTLSLIGQTVSWVMAPQWIGRGLFLQASLITLATGAVNVLLCFALVPSYGMKGAAYAALGVYTLALLGNVVMAVWVERRVQRNAAEEAAALEDNPLEQDTLLKGGSVI